MKKALTTFFFSIVLLFVMGCKSSEQKAEALIKDYMFKHLDNFDSYEVVETTIDSAYNAPRFNSQVIDLAIDAMKKEKEWDAHFEKLQDELRLLQWRLRWFDIGGRELVAEYENLSKETDNVCTLGEKLFQDYVDIHEIGDTLSSNFIGWEVNHKFRYNNRGVTKTLGENLFIMDKKFKRIITAYDSNDKDLQAAFKIIEYVLEVEADVWKDMLKAIHDRDFDALDNGFELALKNLDHTASEVRSNSVESLNGVAGSDTKSKSEDMGRNVETNDPAIAFIRKMYDEGLYLDDGFIRQHCTAKMKKKLIDYYDYDGCDDCYATWLFRSGAQDTKNDTFEESRVLNVVATGDSWYEYSALDMGWEFTNRISLIRNGNTFLIDDVVMVQEPH